MQVRCQNYKFLETLQLLRIKGVCTFRYNKLELNSQYNAFGNLTKIQDFCELCSIFCILVQQFSSDLSIFFICNEYCDVEFGQNLLNKRRVVG